MPDLAATEDRIWSLLEPYRGELEESTIYGMPALRWPGARAHDYFAAVKAAQAHVSLFLIVADTYSDTFAGASEALRKRRSGKATFRFQEIDDDMAGDLAQLLERFYARYRADHVA